MDGRGRETNEREGAFLRFPLGLDTFVEGVRFFVTFFKTTGEGTDGW